MTDQINPSHYRTDPSGVECIEITRHRNFAIGSAFKYLWRAGLKQEEGKTAAEKQIEDLEKAAWYIRDEIQRLKNGAGEPVFGGTLHTGKKEEKAMAATISDLQREAHTIAKEKGFWDDGFRLSAGSKTRLTHAYLSQKLALIHAEVSEALEELRNFDSDCLRSQEDMIRRYAEDGKPEGIASELADVVIRTLDLAEWLAIDLGQVIEEKMAYNATRPAKHGKNF